ncbi:hypothetical protein [Agromyces sp. H66]|uniref:hypothetical protein n=1 Tax=Agromyces sp. H66 TaxID=2529859 RepID=UPI0010AA19E6|nr:hypothetical protein [Agromyces sp. H66]
MSTETLNWVPSSCTLPTVERPLREREFERLFASELRDVTRTSATSAEFALTSRSVAAARDLAGRETSCCSFFTFDIRDDGVEAVMSIAVPPAHTAVLEAIVGSALRARDSRAAGA